MFNPQSTGEQWPRPAYAWFVVAVLFLAFVVSYVDRMVLALLIPQIKGDFALSDTQISLLIGFAFSLFYAAMAIPIGRWADTSNRRNIIMGGLLLWTAMTAISGLATNFARLFAARIGVGVGEATLGPCALSIISDHFPPARRARPVAVFALGGVFGVATAYVLGGMLIEFTKSLGALDLSTLGTWLAAGQIVLEPWQLTFVLVSLPGILVALLLTSVREPSRKGVLLTEAPGKRMALREVAGFAARRWRAYAALYGGVCLMGAFAYGTVAWTPTLMVRRYELNVRDIGLLLGASALIGGILSTYILTQLADWLRKRGRADALLLTTMFAMVTGGPLTAVSFLMPTTTLFYVLHVLAGILMTSLFAMPLAALQLIVPNQMRGLLTALYFFALNVIGTGAGPLIAALMTDFVFQDEARIHHSLALLGLLFIPPAVALCTFGLRDFRGSVTDAEAWYATGAGANQPSDSARIVPLPALTRGLEPGSPG